MFRRIRVFLNEVMAEMNKVSWPIKRGRNIKPSERFGELTGSTVTVVVSSVLLAAYIGGVDIVLSNLIKLLIGR